MKAKEPDTQFSMDARDSGGRLEGVGGEREGALKGRGTRIPAMAFISG